MVVETDIKVRCLSSVADPEYSSRMLNFSHAGTRIEQKQKSAGGKFFVVVLPFL